MFNLAAATDPIVKYYRWFYSVNGTPATEGARKVLVEPVASESGLRYRGWVERNRQHVAQASGGRVGYVHVPDTGVNGQDNLFRQFHGQKGTQALIVDERFNGGGQIPTRFIELLNRPSTNSWAVRAGAPFWWPPDSHQGPKCMLINQRAGSGGDCFPYYFRQAGLGPLIGMRTWGGLVGIGLGYGVSWIVTLVGWAAVRIVGAEPLGPGGWMSWESWAWPAAYLSLAWLGGGAALRVFLAFDFTAATEAAADRWTGRPVASGAKSALISALSLCLLLRTDALWLAAGQHPARLGILVIVGKHVDQFDDEIRVGAGG